MKRSRKPFRGALSLALLATLFFVTSCKDAVPEIAPETPVEEAGFIGAADPSLAALDTLLSNNPESVISAQQYYSIATTGCSLFKDWELTNTARLHVKRALAQFNIYTDIGIAAITPSESNDFVTALPCDKLGPLAVMTWTPVDYLSGEGVTSYAGAVFFNETNSTTYLLTKHPDFLLLSFIDSEVRNGIEYREISASIQFFWADGGTPPVVEPPVVEPPVVTPPGNVSKGIYVTADSAKVDNDYVKNNLRDGSADGHYGVWQGVSKSIAPLFGLTEADMIAPVPTR